MSGPTREPLATMFASPVKSIVRAGGGPRVSPSGTIAVIAPTAAVIWLGVFPALPVALLCASVS